MNTGWLLAGLDPTSTTRSASRTSANEQVVAAAPIVSLSASVEGAWQMRAAESTLATPRARAALAATHRGAEATEGAELLAIVAGERSCVGQRRRIEGVGGVELQELQPGRAEVDALDRPVVEAGDAEGAPVARALGQDPPGVERVAAVLPDGAEDVGGVVGLLVADAVGRGADPASGTPALA